MIKVQSQGAPILKLLQQPSVARAPAAFEAARAKGVAKQQESLGAAAHIDISGEVQAKQLQDALLSEIGKKIDAVLGDAGVDLRDAAGMDWSAEATADRIFNFAAASFETFAERHDELTPEEQLDQFESLIRGAVDSGAQDAMAILVSAGYEDETRPLAERTMELVHEKFDDFFEDRRSKLE